MIKNHLILNQAPYFIIITHFIVKKHIMIKMSALLLEYVLVPTLKNNLVIVLNFKNFNKYKYNYEYVEISEYTRLREQKC